MSKQAKHAPRHIRTTSTRKAVLIRRAIGMFFALVFVFSALGLVVIGCMMYHDQQELDQLAMLAGKAHSAESQSTLSSASEGNSAPNGNLLPPADNTTPSVISPYEALFQKNNDFWGWIQIEDTKINYPIMHSPDDPEKYLNTNFDGEYSYSGLPFLDAACTTDSDNLLIYGHNMIDGSMFAGLTKYKNQSYWEAHPIIKLDILDQEYEYEVVFAFYDRVYSKTDNVFKFYRFIDAENEQDFNNAIANFRQKQLYDTGIDVSFGNQLITLVTCEYHTNAGRFVVVAQRK